MSFLQTNNHHIIQYLISFSHRDISSWGAEGHNLGLIKPGMEEAEDALYSKYSNIL
jgi:hypothetical protein